MNLQLARRKMKRIVTIAVLGLSLSGLAANAQPENRKQVYAPPNVFGEWTEIAAHIGGPMKFKVRVEPIGETIVTGEIEYFDKDNKKVSRSFFKEATVEVGNSYASVRVRLKGTPFGSSCWVITSP
jgi:hypothetical protein